MDHSDASSRFVFEAISKIDEGKELLHRFALKG